MSGTEQTVSSIGNSAVGFDTSSTVTALSALLRDPTSNPQLAMVVFALAVLVALLLIVILMMLITPSRRKIVKVRRYTGVRPESSTEEPGEDSVASASPRPSGWLAVAASSVTIAVLVVVAVLGTYVATSTDSYCGVTCHGGSALAKSAAKVDHAYCVSCHEPGGVLGVFANASSRARMVVAYALGQDAGPADVAFDSRGCSSCHAELNDGVTVSARGVRMSHAEVTSAGHPCIECHATAGHGSSRMTAPMAVCMPCHDSRTASAECKTCHTKDYVADSASPTSTIEHMGTGNLEFPAVRAAKRECGGCHDQERDCDPCHGIRMPHSRDFREGGHARAAAFEKKLMCWKCHDPQFCSNTGCHNSAFNPDDGSTSHGRDWKQQHRIAAWDAGCVCHGAVNQRKVPMCTLCHDARSHRVLAPTP